MHKDFHQKLKELDNGAYDVSFDAKRYLLRKQTQLKGKLIKLYAEELGGSDFISLNYYPGIKGGSAETLRDACRKGCRFYTRA
jgi:hypothetical protein